LQAGVPCGGPLCLEAHGRFQRPREAVIEEGHPKEVGYGVWPTGTGYAVVPIVAYDEKTRTCLLGSRKIMIFETLAEAYEAVEKLEGAAASSGSAS
jgi:hypothetical protein